MHDGALDVVESQQQIRNRVEKDRHLEMALHETHAAPVAVPQRRDGVSHKGKDVEVAGRLFTRQKDVVAGLQDGRIRVCGDGEGQGGEGGEEDGWEDEEGKSNRKGKGGHSGIGMQRGKCDCCQEFLLSKSG